MKTGDVTTAGLGRLAAWLIDIAARGLLTLAVVGSVAVALVALTVAL